MGQRDWPRDYAEPAMGGDTPAWDCGAALDAWRMPEQRSVTSTLVRLCMDGAEQHGIGPQEFQRLTGIAAWELESPQARICASKHLAVMRLVQHMPMPSDYWQFDIQACLQPFPTLYAVVANAPNLAAGLGAYFHHRSLIGNVDVIRCLRQGTQFEFDYQLDDSGGNAFSAFGNFFLLHGIVRHYDPEGGRACLLELTGEAFAPATQLRAAMGCEVRFGQARNRLLLQAPASDQPYAQHNPNLYDFFLGQARAEQARLEPTQTFALGLQRFLAQAIAAGDAIGSGSQLLAQACAHFKTSRWGLHRRLQQEATHFQEVLGRVRATQARHMLLQAQSPISEISDLLGFSSLSAFSRFFSGAFGVSPSQFRKQAADATVH